MTSFLFSQEHCRTWTRPSLWAMALDGPHAKPWCREACWEDWRVRMTQPEPTSKERPRWEVSLLDNRPWFSILMRPYATRCWQKWSTSCATQRCLRCSDFISFFLPLVKYWLIKSFYIIYIYIFFISLRAAWIYQANSNSDLLDIIQCNGSNTHITECKSKNKVKVSSEREAVLNHVWHKVYHIKWHVD